MFLWSGRDGVAPQVGFVSIGRSGSPGSSAWVSGIIACIVTMISVFDQSLRPAVGLDLAVMGNSNLSADGFKRYLHALLQGVPTLWKIVCGHEQKISWFRTAV